MRLAQIGLFTSALEAAATAIGAGIVIGSVAMGVAGLVLGWTRQEIGDRALVDGYVGGLFGAALAVIDITLRYLS